MVLIYCLCFWLDKCALWFKPPPLGYNTQAQMSFTNLIKVNLIYELIWETSSQLVCYVSIQPNMKYVTVPPCYPEDQVIIIPPTFTLLLLKGKDETEQPPT